MSIGTRTRIYELYPCLGTFSCKTVDYYGTVYTVSATSVRQAYAVAHKGVWIDPTVEHPVGIVSVYRRDKGTTLWCGCSGHQLTGGQVNHGAGIRALRAAISAHRCGQEAAAMTCPRGICPGCGQFNVGVSTGQFETCMRCELLAHRDPPAPHRTSMQLFNGNRPA